MTFTFASIVDKLHCTKVIVVCGQSAQRQGDDKVDENDNDVIIFFIRVTFLHFLLSDGLFEFAFCFLILTIFIF